MWSLPLDNYSTWVWNGRGGRVCSLFHYHEPNTPSHGPLARYNKLRVAHAPVIPGTFSPPLRVSDPDMHHGTCVMHVPQCMPGSLTSGFLCGRWRGKRSRHSLCMHNSQFYVSGKRPIHYATIMFIAQAVHQWVNNSIRISYWHTKKSLQTYVMSHDKIIKVQCTS